LASGGKIIMDYEKLENDLARESLSLASTSSRGKAFILDELLISTLVMIAFWDKISGAVSITESIEAVNSLFMVIVVLKIAYQSVFVYMYGATLGKIWQKIMVVEVRDFYRPSLLVAINKAIIRIFSEWVMYFGFIWAYMNDNKQTWHDKVGKTIVIDV
jgi:uncharacterized RDD family membrane protein YckC